MAKTLGAKTLLIRDALQAHPDKSPKQIADLINASDARKQDKIEVKPIDVSQQKLALKKAAQAGPAAPAEPARKKPGRKPGRKPGKKATESSTSTSSHGAPAAAPVAAANPVDLIDNVFALAEQCGGMAHLKRLVERLSGVQQW
jgi:hypothetical protein